MEIINAATDAAPLVAAVLAAALPLAAFIAKLTPSKRDDEWVANAKPVVGAVVSWLTKSKAQSIEDKETR